MPPIEPKLSAQGRALLDAGRAADAVEVLRRAVASGEEPALDLLARAYLDNGSWAAAAEWLGALVEGGRPRFAGRLGVARAGLGDANGAEDAFRTALENGEIAAANDLGILLRDQNRFGEAVQVLTRAAEQGDRQAPDNLVALHLEAGDLPAAIEVAERWVADDRPETLTALAEVRAAARRDDEADELHRRACELGGLRAHTAYGTFLLTSRGDVDRAEREFRDAVRHNESGSSFALAQFLVDTGRPDEARPHLQVGVDHGDRAAVAALAELDGEDLSDD
ncbi:MAG: tetratricopeptide repeat protein [Pseudonocardia sp.]|nr:tetratricopeptide repeat protein [Pseudonocardia sp.]